jgi:chromosome segregation ATPase
MADKTNKELIQELSESIKDLRSKMPNGEFEIIRLKLEGLETDVQDIKEDIDKMKKWILNPEDGVVVKVNKHEEKLTELSGVKDDKQSMAEKIKDLESFKSGMTKALWVIYATVVGLIAKMFFFK